MVSFFDTSAYAKRNRELSAEISSAVQHAAFSPDGHQLVTVSSRNTILIHDLSSYTSADVTTASTSCLPFKAPVKFSGKTTVTSLATTNHALYMATNCGLWKYPWNKITTQSKTDPIPINAFHNQTVSAISPGPDQSGVIIANDTGLSYISESNPDAVQILSDRNQPDTINCLSVSPDNSNLLLASTNNGSIMQYDIREDNGPTRSLSLPTTQVQSHIGKERTTSFSLNSDSTIAMVIDTARLLSAVHVPTMTVLEQQQLDFIPRAIAYSNDAFYCGGSDHRKPKEQSVITGPTIPYFNTSTTPVGMAHVSFDSVYAMATSSGANALAIAGHTPSPYARVDTGPRILADIYKYPPVRSFSVVVL